jgi:hypothetical protein
VVAVIFAVAFVFGVTVLIADAIDGGGGESGGHESAAAQMN